MQVYKISGLLLVSILLAFGPLSTVFGAGRDKDKDGDKSRSTSSNSASKNGAFARSGECRDYGSASAELDVNNVRASIFNNGNLFYNGSDPLYEIPKGSGKQSIFASAIWVGGYVGDELRMAAATYDNFEFRPGPIFADGSAPTNCAPYDRIWKISKTDIDTYETSGQASRDLADWPVDLGAPVIDGDGNPNNYNLAGGDRPELIGDQMIWFVMNDVSAPHDETETNPIGLEAQVTAFAFNQAGALGNTTFYKYKLTYRGSAPLEDAYIGLWSDPDLGDSGDDYVGSDTTLGLGFVYNGDNFDGGSTGYGNSPPALGYDFFQGPLVEAPGETWVDPDSTVYQNAKRLGMQRFVYYNNVNAAPDGNPFIASDYYGYLTGFWKDGLPVTFGGTGRGFSNIPAAYMYPANPPEFWSEENIDNAGTAISPSDRRFIQSAGPFTMNPGDVQEIVFGIVWSQADESAANPRHESVQKLKEDDALAQNAFDVDFKIPAPPEPPMLSATPLDQSVALSWQYEPRSNNYLGSYNVINPVLSQEPFVFEGFILYEYQSTADAQGRIIGVFDKANGVGRILQPQPDGLVTVDVNGSDSGLRWALKIDNLTNYKEYHYGIQAYAYNANAPIVTYKSPVRRVSVVPSRVTARNGGTDLAEEAIGNSAGEVGAVQKGQGAVNVVVVDPAQVTGHTYRVEFRNIELVDADGHAHTVTIYDIFDETANQRIFDGEAFARRTGEATPLGTNVFIYDGLSFDITGPNAGPLTYGDGLNAFVEVAGPGDNYGCGPNAVSAGGCAQVGGNLVYASYNGSAEYIMYHNGAGPEDVIGAYAPNDFEIRFTEKGSYALDIFSTGNVFWIPFEVWDIGPTGAFGENDPSDDVQMVATLFSDGGGSCAFGAGEGVDPWFGLEWPFTDRIYAYYLAGTYEEFEAVAKPVVDAAPERCQKNEADESALFDALDAMVDYGRGRPLQRLVFLMAPELSYPPVGVVVRFLTTKPNLPGDKFTFNTSDVAPRRGVDSLAVASVDEIAIVPNPYKGASDYEVSRIVDVVRITNLPQRATIRVFTLNGTLIRTLEKSGPDTYINWNLQTEESLPIASGMYLVHVQAKSEDGSVIGEKVIKFGVVKKLIQLNEL